MENKGRECFTGIKNEDQKQVLGIAGNFIHSGNI